MRQYVSKQAVREKVRKAKVLLFICVNNLLINVFPHDCKFFEIYISISTSHPSVFTT